MSWGEEQQKEIETIRERKITVKLSDADCDRLARKCGEHGLTIGELIENFVGDLVGGTYSNGSDERDYICITDVQKSIDKISGQAKQGQYIMKEIIMIQRRKPRPFARTSEG